MQGYTSWDADRLTFPLGCRLIFPLALKQAQHPIEGLAGRGVLLQNTRFSQGCGDIGEVGHVGAADHRLSQSRRLQGILAAMGSAIGIKTPAHHHHRRRSNPGAHRADAIGHHQVIGDPLLAGRKPGGHKLSPKHCPRRPFGFLPGEGSPGQIQHLGRTLGVARSDQQPNLAWPLAPSRTSQPGLDPLLFFTGMATGQEHHGPLPKNLAQPLHDGSAHRQGGRIPLGGASRHHSLGPQPAETLGILLGLGKAALSAANQPSGKPAHPLMVAKGARTHAGIDQLQPRHGMDDLRPQLRFR